MIESRTLFVERSEEIDLYFAFLEDIVDRKAEFLFPLRHDAAPDATRTTKSISLDLSHTLKANGYLLLYNLVEATIVNAIEDIHRKIDSDTSIDADKLVQSLTERALKRFRISNQGTFDTAGPVSLLLLRHWLDDHKAKVANNHHPDFTANIDARKIREVGEVYGFAITTDAAITKNGAQLLTVKTKRNELAHGHIPFRDCGRDISLTSLSEIRREVIAYLDDVLMSVEGYILGRKYRRSA